jgi:hypothetical protein
MFGKRSKFFAFILFGFTLSSVSLHRQALPASQREERLRQM